MVSAGTPASTGRAGATRSASSTSGRLGHRPLRGRAHGGRAAGARRGGSPPASTGVAIERPDGPVVDALLEAEPAGRRHRQPRSQGAAHPPRPGRQQGRPRRRVRPRRRPAHRRAPAAAAPARHARDRGAAGDACGRARTSCGPGCALVQQLGAHLGARLPRCRRPLRRPRLAHRAGLPAALPLAPSGRPGSARGGWPAGWRPRATPDGRSGAELHARLVAAPAGISGDEAEADGGGDARATSGRSPRCASRPTLLEARIGEQLASHPDGHIFTSLPRSGTGAGRGPAGRDRRLPGALPDRRSRWPASRAPRPPPDSPASTGR